MILIPVKFSSEQFVPEYNIIKNDNLTNNGGAIAQILPITEGIIWNAECPLYIFSTRLEFVTDFTKTQTENIPAAVRVRL